MAKYLRLKSDGFVYDYNPELMATGDMELFESDTPPPERIPDLAAYLLPVETPIEVVRRKAKARAAS